MTQVRSYVTRSGRRVRAHRRVGGLRSPLRVPVRYNKPIPGGALTAYVRGSHSESLALAHLHGRNRTPASIRRALKRKGS